ncbi:MAG TPA: hypothetical protein VKR22_02860 [Acidimicrobiales bacterium]|nr:hypothetical protein [Acidimicrobiales bacterium]
MTVVDRELLAQQSQLTEPEEADSGRLSVGTLACFWSRFLDGWVGGFVVVEVLPYGYHLARCSDGAMVGEFFSCDEVMRERRRHPR